ncbi:MAG: hypothetical protein H0X66_06015 [Verrucomicrobia bacterium]|nr:hypothetical protein [Verrucomicrobiota bacterium]
MEVRCILDIEKDSAPPLYQYVIVCSEELNCLGFLDRFGIWRDAHSLTALPEVDGWIDA